MKTTIILFLVFKFSFIFSQSFSGILEYKYSTDDFRQLKMLSLFGGDANLEANNLTEHFYINRDTMISSEYDSIGSPLFSGLKQYGDSTFIYNDISGNYINLKKIQPKAIKYKFIKKTKERKIILNQICTKYIYELSNPNIEKNPIKTIIYAWIPKGYKYPDTQKMGGFFSLYFFNEGIVFQKELLYKGTKRIWTLVKIEK